MHLHILGICGTFMGSLALLAKALGHHVTGADANVYPPMSTQLEAAGIALIEGFAEDQLDLKPDVVVVGNVVSRGNPVMEAVLDRNVPFTSGPQWLFENLLREKWVLAVAGTHGKTTTASMLAWILEDAGFSPGYLIGGVPGNFSRSARLGESDFFVIEADEYDTAFFDKRSKFVHYHPRTLVINNLEYDHADIFPDLAAIQRQFHHLIRALPRAGAVIYHESPSIEAVLRMGCWSERRPLGRGSGWYAQLQQEAGGRFIVNCDGQPVGEVKWDLNGMHNVQNAMSAVAAARHVGVDFAAACQALGNFGGVKRRMEKIGEFASISVYDDFAHHPTAIASTLAGLRAKVGDERIVAVIEPRSNTMKQGVHKNELLAAIAQADEVLWYQDPALGWNLAEWVEHHAGAGAHQRLQESRVFPTVDDMLARLTALPKVKQHIVIMSNGGFQNIHQRLLKHLGEAQAR